MPCAWITALAIGYLAIRHDDKVLRVTEKKSLPKTSRGSCMLVEQVRFLYQNRLVLCCQIQRTKRSAIK